MKTLKRMLAVMLAVVMMMGLGVTSMAATPSADGKYTILVEIDTNGDGNAEDKIPVYLNADGSYTGTDGQTYKYSQPDTNEIENYLGFQSVTGIELAEKMESHVRQYPVDFVTAGVKALKHLSDGSFAVQLDDGKSLQGKTVIVTAGKKSRTLDIPGEIEYTGRGVSYCATCDGPFYRNKTVAIVGGGDSAVQAAIEMSMISQKVYLLVRSRIRAAEIVVKRMYEKENIEVLMEYIPLRINGERKVTSLVVRNKKDEKEIELAVDGVFVEAGGIPNNSYLPKDVITNSLGEIITDKEGKTNIPGLFAAGDVTDGKNKQVIIAAGEGAAAALAAHDYLMRN